MIPQFMAWLQESMLGHAMRDHGVWTYAVVNLIHILGISTLFGSVLVLDLRLVGVWRHITLDAIAEPAIRVGAIGFAIAASSGVCLLATKATEYVANPFLYVKFAAIGLGLLNVFLIRDLSRLQEKRLAIGGGVSLFCWLTAITAGRLIAYW